MMVSVAAVVLGMGALGLIRFAVWLERVAEQAPPTQPAGIEHGNWSTLCGDVRVTASPEAAAFIKNAGGMVFVRAHSTRSARLSMTVLQASCNPPPGALTFRRLGAGFILLFVDPGMRELPHELMLDVRGRRRPRLAAYWDGLAYRI